MPAHEPVGLWLHKLLAKLWQIPHRSLMEKREQLELLTDSENPQNMQEDVSEGIEGIGRQISEAEVQV